LVVTITGHSPRDQLGQDMMRNALGILKPVPH
jgi:hypothetical protein